MCVLYVPKVNLSVSLSAPHPSSKELTVATTIRTKLWAPLNPDTDEKIGYTRTFTQPMTHTRANAHTRACTHYTHFELVATAIGMPTLCKYCTSGITPGISSHEPNRVRCTAFTVCVCACVCVYVSVCAWMLVERAYTVDCVSLFALPMSNGDKRWGSERPPCIANNPKPYY